MTREEAIKEIKSWAIPSERGREVLETLIPELVENEDERIRRELIEFIQWSVDRGMMRHDFHQAKRPSEWIAYLEKQKDILSERATNITTNMLEDRIEGIQRELIEFLSNTINAPWVDVIKSADAYAQRIRSMVEKQKEQKPVKCELEDAFKYYTDAGITISCEDIVAKPKDQKPEPVFKVGDKIKLKFEPKYPYREIVDIKNGAYYFDEAVYLPFDNQDNWEREQKSMEKQDYSGLTEFERAIHRGFLSAGVEDVPVVIIKETAQDCLMSTEQKQEWSKDFDEEVEKIHKRYPEVSFAKLTRIAYHFSKWANRYKDIELSEEDEKDIAHIIRILDDCYAYGKHDLSKTDYDNLTSMIKSLRPHWKPSEEQMEALKNSAYGTYQNGDGPVLRGLYEQLLKLGVKL